MKQKNSRFTMAVLTIFAAMLACNTSTNATEAPASQPPTELVTLFVLRVRNAVIMCHAPVEDADIRKFPLHEGATT